ncbi:hypothetical protein OSTOST_18454, partial [Ostertagia ostertagi]
MIAVFLLLIVWIANAAALEVACYHCYGNSTTEGQFCSIDNLCLGESCYFTVHSSGEWSASCANSTAPPTLVCSTNSSFVNVQMHCGSDATNSDTANRNLTHKLLGQTSHSQFIHFNLAIHWSRWQEVQHRGRSLSRYLCGKTHFAEGTLHNK